MQSLASLVRHHARRAPDAVAVVHGADRLTYGELDEQSDRLAGALLAAGVGPGDRVVLLVPRSTGLIRSVFGVLKGRGVYVPLEIDAPAARLVPRIAAAEPRVVIAHPRAAHLLGAVRA
ncbi:AMP-binding protein, partial [Dactylosporangium sp. NPDC005572]|uniref:AMP-binding protein n=1 Tax=Dactylosporangium sp. NPDC005572 TaxID=3156889 RepID=UPI0033A280E2